MDQNEFFTFLKVPVKPISLQLSCDKENQVLKYENFKYQILIAKIIIMILMKFFTHIASIIYTIAIQNFNLAYL